MSIIIRIAICVRILWSCRMRVSRDEAARNRTKVVEAAAEKFRQRGYDGIGVVGLMEAAGLTHGGFYKQFADKEALVVERSEEHTSELQSLMRISYAVFCLKQKTHIRHPM